MILPAASTGGGGSRSDAVSHFIEHHVLHNPHEWHHPGFSPVHLPFGLSLHEVMALIAAVFLCLLFIFGYRKDQRVPGKLSNLLEVLVLFVRDEVCVPAFGEEEGRKMTPIFCTFFFWILIMNLMGLIPLFSTATSNMTINGALAGIIFLFLTIGGLIKHRGPIGYAKAFIPHGIPWPVLLIIVPLEFFGLLIKCGVLMMRLYCNMIAGHIVLLAMIGMIATYGLYAFPALFLAVGVFILEILVAFIQAFVFTILAAVFVGQVFHPDH